jgi:hypothetical protein
MNASRVRSVCRFLGPWEYTSVDFVFPESENENVKTTINFPEAKLREAMRNAKTKVMRDAIETAIDDYNHRCRLARVADMLGTFEDFMSLEELMEMRLMTVPNDPDRHVKLDTGAAPKRRRRRSLPRP